MSSSTRNTQNIVCDDEYEAEKLMWILSPKREQHNLKDVYAVGETEMIVVLDDDSSHSIMMSDKESAARLQKAVHMILFQGRKLLSIRTHRTTVQIDIR